MEPHRKDQVSDPDAKRPIVMSEVRARASAPVPLSVLFIRFHLSGEVE